MHNLGELLLPLQNMRAVTKFSVRSLLHDLRSEVGRFANAAEYSDLHPYGRRLLAQTPAIEILLMGFGALEMCAPHDHGGSDGLVLVCAGTAEHLLYQLKDNDLKLRMRKLEPSGNIIEAPVDCVHAMGNATSEPLVTLHVYWPPIEQMTVYDLKGRKVYEVNNKAGAWLPIAPDALISCSELSPDS